jgi:hypothetical protein
MADFPIQFRISDYRTEHGRNVRAKRAYMLYEFIGTPIVCDGFVDSAAPFSVVPYTFSRHLPWTRIGKSLTKVGGAVSAPLSWQGIPCELGTIQFRWIHLTKGLRSAPLKMLAKFPQRASVSALERAIVLGLSLFDDNDLQLLMNRGAGTLSAYVSAP